MNKQTDVAIKDIAQELKINLPQNPSFWYDALLNKINELVSSDFEGLVNILYRLDVSEERLVALLKSNPTTDAPLIITNLIIERHLKKIKSRQEFNRRDDNIAEEERW